MPKSVNDIKNEITTLVNKLKSNGEFTQEDIKQTANIIKNANSYLKSKPLIESVSTLIKAVEAHAMIHSMVFDAIANLNKPPGNDTAADIHRAASAGNAPTSSSSNSSSSSSSSSNNSSSGVYGSVPKLPEDGRPPPTPDPELKNEYMKIAIPPTPPTTPRGTSTKEEDEAPSSPRPH